MLAERLEEILGISYEEPLLATQQLAYLLLGTNYPTEEEADDLLASLARYLRVPWEWAEQQTFDKLLRLSAATGRLLRAENGKRDPLDLRAASEENR